MSTKREIAQKYAGRIKTATYKGHEADRIIKEINELTYSETKEPISAHDKQQLIEIIGQNLPSGTILFKEGDNRNYLQLVNYMLAQIKE